MGLDLLVMPLWRYFAGRFEGPLEALATRVGNPKPSDSELLARWRARGIKEQVERRAGRALSWSDDGEVALSVQHHYASLQALRAFAAYQEYPLGGPFAAGSSPEEHPSLARIYYQNAPSRYRHLIDHSDCMGFYFPCDFDPPVACLEIVDGASSEPSWAERLVAGAAFQLLAWRFGAGKELREERRQAKEREQRIRKLRRESPYPPPRAEAPPKVPRGKSLRDWFKVGSSVRLLRELEELGQRLPGLRDETAPADYPMGAVKYGWRVLERAARVSVERSLPLIFDG
ncbi:MAG: hypothetical protein HY293_05780 [Planctomycetes bacterium]|nr:hypothetical protein [Planctomycetota bacterium]